jgi:hypothetical protein
MSERFPARVVEGRAGQASTLVVTVDPVADGGAAERAQDDVVQTDPAQDARLVGQDPGQQQATLHGGQLLSDRLRLTLTRIKGRRTHRIPGREMIPVAPVGLRQSGSVVHGERTDLETRGRHALTIVVEVGRSRDRAHRVRVAGGGPAPPAVPEGRRR